MISILIQATQYVIVPPEYGQSAGMWVAIIGAISTAIVAIIAAFQGRTKSAGTEAKVEVNTMAISKIDDRVHDLTKMAPPSPPLAWFPPPPIEYEKKQSDAK